MSQKIVFDNFGGGENQRDARRSIASNESWSNGTVATNAQAAATGRLERRYGVAQSESGFAAAGLGAAERLTGAAMYRPTNSGGSKFLLFAGLKRIRSATYSAGVFTYDADISGANINTGDLHVPMTQYKDWMFMTVPYQSGGSQGRVYRFDGVKVDGTFGGVTGFTLAQLEAPVLGGTTAVSAAAGGRMAFAGTAAIGEYLYRFSYIHGVLGESNLSPPIAASALGAATAVGQVQLAALPWSAGGFRNTSARRTITAVRVYRTLKAPNLNDDTLNTYYLITTLAVGTATYLDQKDDLELASAYSGDAGTFWPTYELTDTDGMFLSGLVPTYMCVHKSRLWLANYTEINHFKRYQSLITWSKLNQPCKVDTFVDIRDGDGFAINGMRSFNGELIVFKDESVHAISGDSPQNFAQRVVIADLGCIAPLSIAEGDGYLFWLSSRGVVRWDGYSRAEIISAKIRPYFETMSATAKSMACGGFHRGRYFLGVNRQESAVWVYDNSYGSPGSWWKWNNLNSNMSLNPFMFLKLNDVQENGEFYMLADSIGSAGGGQIRQFHDAFSNSGAPRYSDRAGGVDAGINLFWPLRTTDAGLPETMKQFLSVTIDAEELGVGLGISWTVDGDASSYTVAPILVIGTGTEASPKSSATSLRPMTFSLPDSANGRRIYLDLNPLGFDIQKPFWINRLVIEYEEIGEEKMSGTY